MGLPAFADNDQVWQQSESGNYELTLDSPEVRLRPKAREVIRDPLPQARRCRITELHIHRLKP